MRNNPELPDGLKRCVEFHGHLCPGLVVGYCAATLGMQRLAADRSKDEELIAIVENDSCAVDAVQVLSGCTFGKGNLFFLDYGKMVFTFAVRSTGKSVRLCYQPLAPTDIEGLPEDQRHSRQIEFMLAQPVERFFTIRQGTRSPLPEVARIHQNIPCDGCGEMVMASRIRTSGARKLCVPCANEAGDRFQ